MRGQQEHQEQAGQYRERAQLKVLTALRKMIPGPNQLRQGHGDQRDGSQQQQKANHPGIETSHARDCIKVQLARVGRGIQIAVCELL